MLAAINRARSRRPGAVKMITSIGLDQVRTTTIVLEQYNQVRRGDFGNWALMKSALARRLPGRRMRS